MCAFGEGYTKKLWNLLALTFTWQQPNSIIVVMQMGIVVVNT